MDNGLGEVCFDAHLFGSLKLAQELQHTHFNTQVLRKAKCAGTNLVPARVPLKCNPVVGSFWAGRGPYGALATGPPCQRPLSSRQRLVDWRQLESVPWPGDDKKRRLSNTTSLSNLIHLRPLYTF